MSVTPRDAKNVVKSLQHATGYRPDVGSNIKWQTLIYLKIGVTFSDSHWHLEISLPFLMQNGSSYAANSTGMSALLLTL